uniref:ATP-dependent RNA helicase n=1 Tax=Gouania willdenowi TaxID=441366 RepID=A0A8C5GRL0_GOUWI
SPITSTIWGCSSIDRAPDLHSGGLKDLGIKKYTSIQNLMIPKILKNQSCIGISATGTGKTFCFLIPILEKLEPKQEIQFIIILPTRELARQISSKFLFFRKYYNFSIKLLIGGKSESNFQKNQIIVSTPQKLIDFISKNKPSFKFLKLVVFDEADMLIDEKSSSIFENIFTLLPNRMNFQKIAFSATLHEMLSKQLTRMQALENLLLDFNPYFCIIFANKKSQVEAIHKFMKSKGLDVLMLHGDLESRKRKNVYKMIERKAARFLVSTDLASRGIDILGVSHVVSFNLPEEDLNYQSGLTYTLVSKEDDLKISRLNNNDHTFNVNDKVAQGIIRKHYFFELEEVQKLSKTKRDQAGFGSTGK